MSDLTCNADGTNCITATTDAVAMPIAHAFDWMPIVHGAEIVVGIIFVLIMLNLWLGPLYRVWAAHQKGLADLALARNDQQIQVAEAQGRLAAAEANKQAAIVEAEAVAAQISVIGDNVKEHPLYLTWQWIKMMEERHGTTVYVPTEANLPILEAGRMALDKS